MANTFTAPFAQTPKNEVAVATAAVSLTGANSLTTSTPNNTVLLLTAGADGAMVTALSAITRATNVATSLLYWISTDSGTNKFLAGSSLQSAHTIAAGTAIPVCSFKHSDGSEISEEKPLRLEAGVQIYIGTSTVGNVAFQAQMTDF